MRTYVDRKKMKDDMLKLSILENRTGDEELTHQGKLLVRDLILLTPPTGKHALTEGWKVQRESGVNAVNRDIAKKWRSANSILSGVETSNPHAAKSLKNYIRTGNIQAFRTLAQKLGIIAGPDYVTQNVSESDHDEVRSSATGRAIGKFQKLVLGSNSIKQLVRTKVGHVGRAKAGWMKAATALGVSVPQWISNHTTPGIYQPDLVGPNKSLTLGNLVRYARNLAPKRIINNALKIRARAIELRIKHKMQAR